MTPSARPRPALLALLLAVAPAGAAAGPPYTTDDPEPVELHHWEVYLASQAAFDGAGFSGTVPHLEVNYGAAPELQLHLIAPLVLATEGGARYGPGDLELGAKYRFVEEERGWVQVGTFPIVTLPTGSAARGLGEGSATVLLPLWLQKSFGPWTTYGGGGYRIRAGEASRSSWFVGWQGQRRLGPVALGAEVFYETARERGGSGEGGFNVGCVADLSELHHLLASVGASQGSPGGHAYLAWQLTFGPAGKE